MSDATSPAPAYVLHQICKSFKQINAVANLNLTIPTGIIFGLMGANGSGKTTTLKLLNGLLIPDSGSGSCLGLDLVSQITQIQTNIGYMPQKFCLYQNLSVYENLDFIGRIYGLKQRQNRLGEIIELLSLSGVKNQIAATLSGGWQSRVALAAALLHHPKILILDEPTSGLDPETRLVIWEHIQHLATLGVTIILTTHYMDEAERCHQLAYMSFGKLLIHGANDAIIQSEKLFSWVIDGPNISQLKAVLNGLAVPMTILEKGKNLRVSSQLSDALSACDPVLLSPYHIQPSQPTLEDVFLFKIQHEDKQ
ncbi:ABC transporter ATP-binding protein [Legionella sp. W05-934-2]|jgi:ABC-2 type transport system ATP-binding protein|uniref:ABC transporter ATP-binding protein n=1 Tax=Legionella sp. W05-934-2 TaxID=1198649 RepID=UPI0034622C48